MNTLFDSQSLQSYGLRLQREARGRTTSSTRSSGRTLAPRLRTLVPRRSA